MSNLLTMRATEGVIALAFLATLIWVARQRNPLYAGAVIAGAICFVFDWAWCTRSFFNATFNRDLLPLPGITAQGVTYPWSIALAWGLAFGLPTVLLVIASEWFDRRLGALQYVAIWLLGAIGMTAVENLLTGVLRIYTYHQKPEYLIGTVPWSNLLLNGNLMLLCYAFSRSTWRWAALPANTGFSLASDDVRKGLVLGALPIWGAFVIAYLIQLFWYGLADPWTESGRPF